LTGRSPRQSQHFQINPASQTAASQTARLPHRIPIGNPLNRHPILQSRLDFHEIGLVPALSPSSPISPGWQRSRSVPAHQVSVFHEFTALHWNRVASPHPAQRRLFAAVDGENPAKIWRLPARHGGGILASASSRCDRLTRGNNPYGHSVFSASRPFYSINAAG
jgi:hypothetical protein